MAKVYRRFIRIAGELHTSPRFSKKKDADEWYSKMRRKKQFHRDGFVADEESGGITVFDWARDWIRGRMKNYPMATWKSDEQRLRDYVLPAISDLPLTAVTSSHIRSILKDITEGGKSPKTQTRVKALMSVLFSDAFNHEPQLIRQNPVIGIKLNTKRVGNKVPSHLKETSECEIILKTAKEMGPLFLVIEALGMMAGLRKQEMLALRWKAVDAKKNIITVREKVEQASLTVKAGTKGGEETEREFPVPKILIQILLDFRRIAKYSGDDDFILARASDGRFMNPRDVNRMHSYVLKASGLNVTVHGLRHTFGREFAARSGNTKALQAILGHTSSATTDLYSNLAGNRLAPFGEVVSFKVNRKGVKRSIG